MTRVYVRSFRGTVEGTRVDTTSFEGTRTVLEFQGEELGCLQGTREHEDSD